MTALILPDEKEEKEYSDIDMEALKRAMRLLKFDDPSRAEQINSMLRDQPWGMVAEFCAQVLQTKALCLKPWEMPPCLANDGASEALLDRLLEAGYSQWEPEPIKALQKLRP